jgi:hypothetical protein
MTNRRTTGRRPARRITPKAVEIFRRMVVLEEQDSLNEEYWDCATALTHELRLRPWEGPPYELKLYNALKAASDG